MITNLNPEQMAAVKAGAGAWKVEAGPGSGKTRVVVERFTRLMAEGAPREQVLSLTFTRSAAQEMAERAEVKREPWQRGGFRTFHSFCLNLCMEEAAHLPFKLSAHPIPPAFRLRKALEDVLKIFRGLPYRDARDFIALCRRGGVTPAEAIAANVDFVGAQLAQVYAEYQRRVRAEGWLEFDSMALEAVRLLERPDVAARWQFEWVQADEAQDTDELQWRILQLITRQHGNAYLVGDAMQALYAWRGAAPNNLLRFEEFFPGGQTLFLGVNYRSTAAIVSYCREIAPVRTDLIQHLRAAGPTGSPPEFLGFADDGDEADGIVRLVRNPNNSAVLARTNAQLRALEDACLRAGMTYRLLGKSGFWQRPEIEDLLAFLRVVDAPWDDDAIARIVRSHYSCSKYLGAKFLEKVSKPYMAALKHAYATSLPEFQKAAATKLHKFLTNLRAECIALAEPPRIVESVIARAGMLDGLRDEDDSDTADNWAAQNLEEAVRVAARFRTVEDIVKHARRARAAAKSAKGLTLSTVHQAKGKEWQDVFVCGLTEGILPHERGEIEEERRIYYVACSRAAERLTVTWHGTPSEFLPEEKVLAFAEKAAPLFGSNRETRDWMNQKLAEG